jgi:hypothetical protein
MDLDDATGTQDRFRAYAADLASVLGHADRVRPFEDYCIGLLSAEGRKSVEPLAAVTAAGANRGATPIFAPPCGAGTLVRSGGTGPGTRTCPAIDHPR